MDRSKRRIILISISVFLVIILLVLVFLLLNLNRNKGTSVTTDNVSENINDDQISTFQDVKLIEELLKSGRILDENIGSTLGDSEKDILKDLGVSEKLINTYSVYTSEELLNSGFISSDSEGEQQVEDWKKNYKNERYIISQTQGLAFLVKGRKDEKDRIQYARLVEDEEVYDEMSDDEVLKAQDNSIDTDNQAALGYEKQSRTSINIRKVERLKYNVNIDYPENAVELKYAIKTGNELNTLQTNSDIATSSEELNFTPIESLDGKNQIIDTQSENTEDKVDYNNLDWTDYIGTIFIEENATIYTKYKLSSDIDEYTISSFKKVPELVLSKPTYEIVEDENSMYIKFSNTESDYNNEVKFNISYGKKETEEEPVYCQWYESVGNRFYINEVGKYYIKFIATMPGKNIINSQEMKISIGRLEEGNSGNLDNFDNPENSESGGGLFQIIDTTQEDIVKLSDRSLRALKINGISLAEGIIDSLNSNGYLEYNLSNASSVVIKAYAQDSSATVVGNGIYNFKNNKATIKIQVVSSDGTKSTYTITVNRSTSENSSNSNTNSEENASQTTQGGNISQSGGSSSGTSQGGSINQGDSGMVPIGDTTQGSGSSGGISQGENSSNTVSCSHNWQAATCTTPKTCKKCGEKIEGSELGHSYTIAATCTSARKCSRCGQAEPNGKLAEHKWQTATCEKPKTCTVCGQKVEGSELGHSYTIAATCTSARKCSRCGQAEPNGKLAEHKWQAATCEKPKTCTVCGQKVEGSELGHNWKTVNGITKCSRCGKKA